MTQEIGAPSVHFGAYADPYPTLHNRYYAHMRYYHSQLYQAVSS